MSIYFVNESAHLRDHLHVVRKLARDIHQHRDEPAELGFDLEEMQSHATECPEPFVRTLAVRYLTRRSFAATCDPRRHRLHEALELA